MIRTRIGMICACGLVALAGLGTPALAKGPAGPGGSGAGAKRRAAFMKARRELAQVSQKLQGIQKATIAGNRKLAAQRDKLRKMIEASMKKQGHDPKKGVERLKKLQAKLQSGKLSGAQKKKAISELREKSEALQRAQFKALGDSKIKKASKKFQRKLEAAMIKKDPKAKKLIKRLHVLRSKLKKIMQSAG